MHLSLVSNCNLKNLFVWNEQQIFSSVKKTEKSQLFLLLKEYLKEYSNLIKCPHRIAANTEAQRD